MVQPTEDHFYQTYGHLGHNPINIRFLIESCKIDNVKLMMTHVRDDSSYIQAIMWAIRCHRITLLEWLIANAPKTMDYRYNDDWLLGIIFNRGWDSEGVHMILQKIELMPSDYSQESFLYGTLTEFRDRCYLENFMKKMLYPQGTKYNYEHPLLVGIKKYLDRVDTMRQKIWKTSYIDDIDINLSP